MAEAANLTTRPLSILSGLTIDVINTKTSLAVLGVSPAMRWLSLLAKSVPLLAQCSTNGEVSSGES